MKKINYEQLKKMVGKKIFTVKFTKKDGTKRIMNCRLGVKKHLKGGKLGYNPSELNYLIVYDLVKKGYRTINVNTLEEISFNGKLYNLKLNETFTKNKWSNMSDINNAIK